MRLFVLAAAAALLTASCSEPAANGSSCLKRADENFDKCLEGQGADCTVKRLHEQEACPRRPVHAHKPAS